MKTEKTNKPKSGVKIAFCGCENPYQDKKYGVGNRIKNITAKGGNRCSVCARETNVNP